MTATDSVITSVPTLVQLKLVMSSKLLADLLPSPRGILRAFHQSCDHWGYTFLPTTQRGTTLHRWTVGILDSFQGINTNNTKGNKSPTPCPRTDREGTFQSSRVQQGQFSFGGALDLKPESLSFHRFLKDHSQAKMQKVSWSQAAVTSPRPPTVTGEWGMMPRVPVSRWLVGHKVPSVERSYY